MLDINQGQVVVDKETLAIAMFAGAQIILDRNESLTHVSPLKKNS